jgi:hypothetical protein
MKCCVTSDVHWFNICVLTGSCCAVLCCSVAPKSECVNRSGCAFHLCLCLRLFGSCGRACAWWPAT